MQLDFEKTINGRKFKFVNVALKGTNEAIYTVEFFEEQEKRTKMFEMKMDEDGQWKIQAQILPQYVHEAEFELGDAIDDYQS